MLHYIELSGSTQNGHISGNGGNPFGSYNFNGTMNGMSTYEVNTTHNLYRDFGRLDYTHAYRIDVGIANSRFVVDHQSAGSHVGLVGMNYGVFLDGVRYEFGNSWNGNITVSGITSSYLNFYCDIRTNIRVPIAMNDWYRYGIEYDNFYVRIYDLGVYNQDVAGAVNQGNQIAQQGNQIAQQGNQIAQEGNNLQKEQNNLQKEQNNLQKEQNNLQKEQNQTSKNIFDKISDFFGSFFQNIINAFKSLFIPENGYFEDFFRRLNTFFAEKLGMLYAPIDMFIRLLNSIAGASGGDAGIMFPGIQWEGQYILQPQKVSLSTIAGEVPELQEKIYFVTDIIMVGSVLMLLQNKLREVMQN